MLNIHIFAYAALGKGLSGGDRIFIEFARRWSLRNKVKIYLWREGYQICKKQNLTNSKVQFKISLMEPWWRMGFMVNYFARIIQGVYIAFSIKIENNSDTIIYSASEFWMDAIPAFISKKRFPQIKWAAAWYQTAPNPLVGFSQKDRKNKYRFNALAYWLMQWPMKKLITNFSDFVIVNNEEERKEFKDLDKKKRVIICLGAVDLESVKKFQKNNRGLSKIYDAVFQGRFHPQKGVLELIDIWKQVVSKKPEATLVMIGDGPLMKKVRQKINDENLAKNIKVLGFVFDGDKKYRIFSQSKIVLHPAFYDSGGMAAAEAMAFGLPAIGFNLPAYESYYPQGMVKVKIGSIEEFAKTIEKLLVNKAYYKEFSTSAQEMINKSWSWDNRAETILSKINAI
jgi:glycosyltransferase involved in cell wall biosynthesis